MKNISYIEKVTEWRRKEYPDTSGSKYEIEAVESFARFLDSQSEEVREEEECKECIRYINYTGKSYLKPLVYNCPIHGRTKEPRKKIERLEEPYVEQQAGFTKWHPSRDKLVHKVNEIIDFLNNG